MGKIKAKYGFNPEKLLNIPQGFYQAFSAIQYNVKTLLVSYNENLIHFNDSIEATH